MDIHEECHTALDFILQAMQVFHLSFPQILQQHPQQSFRQTWMLFPQLPLHIDDSSNALDVMRMNGTRDLSSCANVATLDIEPLYVIKIRDCSETGIPVQNPPGRLSARSSASIQLSSNAFRRKRL